MNKIGKILIVSIVAINAYGFNLSPPEYHRQYCANFSNDIACTRDYDCDWNRFTLKCVPRNLNAPDYGRTPWDAPCSNHRDGDGCNYDRDRGRGRGDNRGWEPGRGRSEDRYEQMCRRIYNSNDCQNNNNCEWASNRCLARRDIGNHRACTYLYNRNECVNVHNCEWWQDRCHDPRPGENDRNNCAYNNQTQCMDRRGCFWNTSNTRCEPTMLRS